jgi:DNA-binding transcriptional ArsR family regulator
MDSSGAKITLDQESFRALASDVRVEVLKRLDVRRETVTDLSNLLSLSKPTLLEHLEKLQTAGLVKRIDEGRKWIYYELSDKGRKILHPERVSITLALGAAVVLAAIGVFYLLVAGSAPGPDAFLGGETSFPAADAGSSAAPGIALGSLLIVLSFVSGSLAVALRSIGLRRRRRFFEQLATG